MSLVYCHGKAELDRELKASEGKRQLSFAGAERYHRQVNRFSCFKSGGNGNLKALVGHALENCFCSVCQAVAYVSHDDQRSADFELKEMRR